MKTEVQSKRRTPRSSAATQVVTFATRLAAYGRTTRSRTRRPLSSRCQGRAAWSSNSPKTSAVCPHRMLGPHVSGDSATLICDTSHVLSVTPIEHSLARPPTAPGLHLLYTDKRSSRRVGANSVLELLSPCTTSFAPWLQAVTGAYIGSKTAIGSRRHETLFGCGAIRNE